MIRVPRPGALSPRSEPASSPRCEPGGSRCQAPRAARVADGERAAGVDGRPPIQGRSVPDRLGGFWSWPGGPPVIRATGGPSGRGRSAHPRARRLEDTPTHGYDHVAQPSPRTNPARTAHHVRVRGRDARLAHVPLASQCHRSMDGMFGMVTALVVQDATAAVELAATGAPAFTFVIPSVT